MEAFVRDLLKTHGEMSGDGRAEHGRYVHTMNTTLPGRRFFKDRFVFVFKYE